MKSRRLHRPAYLQKSGNGGRRPFAKRCCDDLQASWRDDPILDKGGLALETPGRWPKGTVQCRRAGFVQSDMKKHAPPPGFYPRGQRLDPDRHAALTDRFRSMSRSGRRVTLWFITAAALYGLYSQMWSRLATRCESTNSPPPRDFRFQFSQACRELKKLGPVIRHLRF